MKIDKKYLREFVVEEFMSEEVYELMKTGVNFMMFVESREILLAEEADKWNEENGYNNPIERIVYRCSVKDDETNAPIMYSVTYTSGLTSVIISGKDIKLGYEELVKKLRARAEKK